MRLIVDGLATVLAPETRVSIEDSVLPELMVAGHRHLERLLAACRDLPPLVTAVVMPDDPNSLAGALAGARHGLITPILIGDAGRIGDVAASTRAHPARRKGARTSPTTTPPLPARSNWCLQGRPRRS